MYKRETLLNYIIFKLTPIRIEKDHKDKKTLSHNITGLKLEITI